MCGELRVDTRLIELRGHEYSPQSVPLRIARAQSLIHSELGHALALNDEYVWRRIKAADKRHSLSKVIVRCIFCPACASLPWWVELAESPEDARWSLYLRIKDQLGAVQARYLLKCDGHMLAAGMLGTLWTMANGDAPCPYVMAPREARL